MPLPVTSKVSSIPTGTSRQAKKRRKAKAEDDTPRAFKRLMAFKQGQNTGAGLDDGKKYKPAKSEHKTPEEAPQIRPGEDLRAFSARVDASLPLAGISSKSQVKDGKDVLGLKVPRTRKERKMHKLYDQWRAEEQKIQDQREEEKELAEEKELDDDAAGTMSASMLNEINSSKKNGKKGRAREEDPWAQLKRDRGEVRNSLNDVAQAPPELHKQQTRLLKVAGAGVNVGSAPKAAGSLRRREELEEARQDVVEAYRRIREHEQRKLDASSN